MTNPDIIIKITALQITRALGLLRLKLVDHLPMITWLISQGL
ncbi:hypothetical protein J2W55_001455 [Mucilaginibacter pocheonensis]|uniref:Uncharacterized protein n=1 Tax=Mucilaginibacter pocheonensis TaxID=398050 RepID=A0ABU1T874_9SPHI|nr:hypothetical protein [Mucilaginibacter pocheonensis]